MKKTLFITLALAATFGLGYGFRSVTPAANQTTTEQPRVTGIGGIFFTAKDPKKLREWYAQHLGVSTTPYGATFAWYEKPDSTRQGQTQWTPFPETTTYFAPSTKDFMINYRVENLEKLVAQLKQEKVIVVDEITTYDYGKFVHLMDAEGNKVELWEPTD